MEPCLALGGMARSHDSLKTADLAATHQHLENVWGAWVAYMWESTTFLACRSRRSCSLADRGPFGLHDPLRQASARANRRSWPGPWISISMATAAVGSYSRFSIPSTAPRLSRSSMGSTWSTSRILVLKGFRLHRARYPEPYPRTLPFFISSSLISLAAHAPAETHCQLAVLCCGLRRGRYLMRRNAYCLSSTMHITAMQTLCT
ncbi:hypothetical protein BGZ61DRAFT_136668 [Ilyonectria robusta]|uniref:uncharacterized protein n=1 Tax=Ilyonectria robusta TaxID=1079257 RepID=UPI001E8D0B2E|nr:uncharacterized protein BGZ61DRAFT_136668 [Ilyonectria robusta]KAH8735187.1 hypothetical protein BGZ61DRAFT_136668 [Ilyonectria robusta]